MESAETKKEALTIYWKLDGFLLRVLRSEAIYFSALLTLFLLNMLIDSLPVGNAVGRIIMEVLGSKLIYIPLAFLYLANLGGGTWGLSILIKENFKEYAGTGHLVNWIFIFVTGWFFLFMSNGW